MYLGQGSAKRTLERLRQILEAHLSKMPEQDHLPGGLIQPVQRLLEAILGLRGDQSGLNALGGPGQLLRKRSFLVGLTGQACN